MDVQINITNIQDHVPEAERNIQTIKENFRVSYHRLPYKSIPGTVIKYMCMEATRKLNLLPAKGGVSRYYSPQSILSDTSIDYNKKYQYTFGTYGKALDDPNTKNNIKAKSLDCLYLKPNFNLQGGHIVYNLVTKQAVTRRKFTKIPVIQLIIYQIHSLSKNDNIDTLKFSSKIGHNQRDITWLTGVYNDDITIKDFEKDEAYDKEEQYENEYDYTIKQQCEKTTKTQQSPNMIQAISLTINKQRMKTRKIMSPMSPRSPKKRG